MFAFNTYFYTENRERPVFRSIDSSDINRFKQHFQQIRHNLKGLCLCPKQPSLLPGEYALSLSFQSFFTLSSEIDLRKSPHLRFLQFNLHICNREIGKSQDNVIQWFNSICETVTSKSLIVEVYGFTPEAGVCNKIQDTIVALNARIETLSVYLFNTDRFGGEVMEMDDVRKLFSTLYEKDIVIEKRLNKNELVCCNFLTFKLPLLSAFVFSMLWPLVDNLPFRSRSSLVCHNNLLL